MCWLLLPLPLIPLAIVMAWASEGGGRGGGGLVLAAPPPAAASAARLRPLLELRCSAEDESSRMRRIPRGDCGWGGVWA